MIRFGLGAVSKKHDAHTKSSDLIGILPLTITQSMVGSTVGIFIAIEVKSPSWDPAKKLDSHEIAQKHFIDWVRSLGGIAGFCNSIDSFLNILKR
jgi:hypothetical protein